MLKQQINDVYEEDVKLACGEDTGPFAHEGNVHETDIMVEAGMPFQNVLCAATLRGSEV